MASCHRLQPAAQQADGLAPSLGSSQTMLSLNAEKRSEQTIARKPNSDHMTSLPSRLGRKDQTIPYSCRRPPQRDSEMPHGEKPCPVLAV